MWNWLKGLFGSKELTTFDQSISRERLIQFARVVIIDDEHSLLCEELRSAGFSVVEDQTGNDLKHIDQQLYDLAILDYHGVGSRFGSSQGMDLLRHIRRVSPRTRVMAYTSRSLTSSESEFFRLSHAVLPKDLGLVESMAAIEDELRKAFSKQHLFDALVSQLSLTAGKERDRVRTALAKALAKGDEAGFKERIAKMAGTAGEKAVDVIISRLFGA